jgi:hypothetical protein
LGELRHGASQVRFAQWRPIIRRLPRGAVRPDAAGRHDPAAGAAHINAVRQRATPIADSLVIRLLKVEMPAAAGCERRRSLRRKSFAIGACAFDKRAQRGHTIGAAGVAVRVDYDKAGAPELDASDGVRELAPPAPDLIFVRGCILLPAFN